jgi:hypothetical protein
MRSSCFEPHDRVAALIAGGSSPCDSSPPRALHRPHLHQHHRHGSRSTERRSGHTRDNPHVQKPTPVRLVLAAPRSHSRMRLMGPRKRRLRGWGHRLVIGTLRDDWCVDARIGDGRDRHHGRSPRRSERRRRHPATVSSADGVVRRRPLARAVAKAASTPAPITIGASATTRLDQHVDRGSREACRVARAVAA